MNRPPSVLMSCQAGSPEDPRRWSGTPARLLAALRNDARLCWTPHSSRLDGQAAQKALAVDRRTGLAPTSFAGPMQRLLRGRTVTKAAAGHRAVLHLGTFDIPLGWSAFPSYLFVDSYYDFWERHSKIAQALNPLQRFVFRRLEKRAIARMRHIFTVGEHVAEGLRNTAGVAPQRITVVGSGLGTIHPYRGVKDYGQGRLLIVAKARPHDKGLFLLAEAFALARSRRPTLTLTVIGGHRYPELSGLAGIHCTGWLTESELQTLFEQAALYVMPASYEPWGLSYLEALVCKTPVMGLNRGALPEISGQGRYGFMLPTEITASTLAERLLDALSDPERLARMGAEGQASCLDRYHWSATAKAVTDRMVADLSGPHF